MLLKIEFTKQNGGIEYASQVMYDYKEKALSLLASLPERLSNPFEGPAFEPLISKRARGPVSFVGKDPFRNIALPSPCGKRERKRKRDMNSKSRSAPFLTRSLWRR